MQKKYKLLKLYPGLPKDWKEGEILFEYKPIVGFVYYSNIKDDHRLNKDDVENNSEYFEKFGMLEELKHYFDITPREQVEADWDKSKENAPKNSITVDEFIQLSKNHFINKE